MSGVRKRKHRVKKTSDFWTLPDGKRLHEQHKHGIRTSLPAGCGIFTLPPEDLTFMRALCETILERLPKLVPWGDGWADQKGRGYAMLSTLSDFPDVQSVVANGILMHDVDSALCTDASVRRAATEKHNFTVKNAFVSMDPPQPHIDAIQRMIEQVSAFLQDPINSPHLQSYERNAVHLNNLVAIQPNFHNGDDYLPLHLDNPRHDGFGVVIVTVALWGSADVVLVDDGDAEGFVPSPKKSVKEEKDPVQGSDRSAERGCQEKGLVDTRKMQVQTSLRCEGGIVFKNGTYLVTKEEKNAEATSGLGLAVDDNNTSFHSTSPSTCQDFTNNISSTIHATDTADTTTVSFPKSPTGTTAAHHTLSNSSNSSNSTPIDHPGTTTTTTSTEIASSSTSWVFPLHPGQCYVLSGPARNTCAHGIVVHHPAAPTEGAKRQCTQAEEAITLASTKTSSTTTDTSTTNPPDTDTTNTTNTLSKIGSDTTSSSSGCNSSTTTGTTKTNYEMQPKEWKGRVSLNFRFGIHTPEQAWHEIDRHWA